jgi:nickel transport protein
MMVINQNISQNISQKTVLPVFGLLCLMGWQAQAIAHGVAIEYQATQAYEIKAAYDTGAPMANAQIAVFAPTDPAKPWLTGTTDAAGRFVFSPSTPGNWEVQVRQAGHGDILVIPVESGSATPIPTAPMPAASSSKVEPGTNAPAGSVGPYTPLQKGVMIGSVIWGCVGTALFFGRGTKRLEKDAHS